MLTKNLKKLLLKLKQQVKYPYKPGNKKNGVWLKIQKQIKKNQNKSLE